MARRRQSVTIKHVAADAGVSLQTTSAEVINKEPNVRPGDDQARAGVDRQARLCAVDHGTADERVALLSDPRAQRPERTIADWRKREGADWINQMLGGMLTCAEHGYRMIVELVDTHGATISSARLLGAIAALQPDGVILTLPHSQNPLITGLLEKQKISLQRIALPHRRAPASR